MMAMEVASDLPNLHDLSSQALKTNGTILDIK
jgi:hypothetical protein